MESKAIPDAGGPAPSPRRQVIRRVLCLVLVVAPAALVVNEWLIRPLLNPLRRSPNAIAADLRQEMPLGAPRSEVQAWVSAQGWPQGGTVRSSDGAPPIQRSLGSYETYGMLINVFVEW